MPCDNSTLRTYSKTERCRPFAAHAIRVPRKSRAAVMSIPLNRGFARTIASAHRFCSRQLGDVIELAGRRVTLRPIRAEDRDGMTISLPISNLTTSFSARPRD